MFQFLFVPPSIQSDFLLSQALKKKLLYFLSQPYGIQALNYNFTQVIGMVSIWESITYCMPELVLVPAY